MNIRNQRNNFYGMPIITKQENLGKRWYVLRTISGKELKVKEYIDALLGRDGDFAQYVSQVLVVTEKVNTIRNNKTVVKVKSLYAGYVFVEAELVGRIPSLLRSVPNVLGFLGTKPTPLTEQEVIEILGTAVSLQNAYKGISASFEVGESVQVSDGPFCGFDARIEAVNAEKERVMLSVKIFGRKTPLELGFTQIKKL